MLIVGTAFVIHELAHRWTARRRGLYASYRMWPMGLFLALLLTVVTTALGSKFIFAAPGAVYISYPIIIYSIDREILKKVEFEVAASGPLSNLALALIFKAVSFSGGLLGFIGEWGFQINSFLAFFNLLPFPPLDGSKIMGTNPAMWGLFFVIAVILTFAPL